MTQPTKWIVTAAADAKGDMAAKLRAEGFTIDQALTEIGVFVGRSSEDVAHRLRSIGGVADVSPDAPIDIGPPDGDSTW